MKTMLVVVLAGAFFFVMSPVQIPTAPDRDWGTDTAFAMGRSPGPGSGRTVPGKPPGPPKPPKHPKPPKPPKPPKAVPEPSTLILLGLGLAAGGGYAFLRNRKNR